ncbi:MAG TPA: hypothetical protein VF786_09525 [Terriglobales bacterium]
MPSAEATVRSGNQDYTWPFGRKHRWSRRVFVLVVLLVLLATGFRPELVAIAWHVRHGHTYDFHGVRFRVPRLAYVLQPAPDQATVVFGRGIVRSLRQPEWTMFNLQYVSPQQLANRGSALSPRKIAAMQGLQPVSVRRTAIVGAMLLCDEYNESVRNSHVIYCERTSPGPQPQFSGSPERVPEFYKFINSAASVAAPTTADAP